jgi:hypothetical protein
VDGVRRYHPTRYEMLFYYPQDTPIDAGRTRIVPRSQCVSRRDVDRLNREANDQRSEILRLMRKKMGADAFRGTERFKRYAEMEREFEAKCPDIVAAMQAVSAPWDDAKIPLSGDAGTLSIIVHFDIVHGRYTANTTGRQRHMVKFLFARNAELTSPSWNHASAAWRGPENDCQAPIWKHI